VMVRRRSVNGVPAPSNAAHEQPNVLRPACPVGSWAALGRLR